MHNSLLPSVSSQLCYSFGSNETISDVNPMLIETKINFYTNSFCFDPRKLCSDNKQFAESCTIPSQSRIYYQAGLPSLLPVKGLEDYSNVVTDYLKNASSYNYKISTPKPNVLEYDIQKSKKRSKSCFTESIMNKKLCFDYEQQFWDHQEKNEAREIPSNKLPVKRSQKLSDKITALQKLVSPYGKTDTASVLQEAYIYIKLLQDQIQDLFDELNNNNNNNNNNSSSNNNKPLNVQKNEEQLDLGNRRLCLGPISMTHKLTQEAQFNWY